MDFPHASPAFKLRNPHLFGLGAVVAAEPKQDRRQPQGDTGGKETRQGRVVVSLVALRRRLMDDDNFIGSCKWLRDAIAATLGIDDGDPRIRFEYAQCRTDGQTGVLVKIEFKPSP